MSINSALSAGASGLLANSSALAAISDNIANVNTVGFKRVKTDFTPNFKISGGGEARFAAAGVSATARADITTAGQLNPTSSKTDLAIEGNGFFVVRPSPVNIGGASPLLFTRAGGFETDSNGFLRNDAGQYLYGWPVAADGSVNANPSNVDALQSINLSNIGGAAESTSRIQINANLSAGQSISPDAATYDATAPATNMASGALTPDYQEPIQIFDTQGGIRTVMLSMMKSPTANQWFAELHVIPQGDIDTGAGLNNGQVATGVVAFDTNGQIDIANTTLPSSLSFLGSDNTAALGANDFRWDAGTGIGGQSVDVVLGSSGSAGGLTQFDSLTRTNSINVNGAIFGSFSGVEISADGFVSATFTNGVVRKIFQIPVATVTNPNGLASVGGGSFQITDQSGSFTLNIPGSGSSGTISSEQLENSNVDIATEFANLIITQRAYSASSRIITTADEMLAEAIQMKR